MNRRHRGQASISARRKSKPVPKNAGLTYVETLIATLILLIGLVPALDALRSAVVGTRSSDAFVVAQHRLRGQLEQLLAEPFADLDAAAEAAGAPTTPSAYSEAPGTPDRLLVFLSPYDGDDADSDGDPFTGTDDGILWIRATVAGTPYELETLISQ